MKEIYKTKVKEKAKLNYANSTPWSDGDEWHNITYSIIYKRVQNWLNRNITKNQVILNAGSGNTIYNTCAKIIYLDIIEKYICKFDYYIVSSVENIPLSDNSIDCIICVGSVLNYVDAQKTIAEFKRVLKKNGKLILEFERSNSAEFLFTKNYAKTIFLKEYRYNNQQHLLWMYNEKFITGLLNFYSLKCLKKYRYHCLSSLLYRLSMSEKKAANYYIYDKALQFCSYFIAHNIILVLEKTTS